MSRSLIVLPDDTAKPILDAIQRRKNRSTSRCLSSPSRRYEGCDRAPKRGVNVRIMLNPARRSGEEENTRNPVRCCRRRE